MTSNRLVPLVHGITSYRRQCPVCGKADWDLCWETDPILPEGGRVLQDAIHAERFLEDQVTITLTGVDECTSPLTIRDLATRPRVEVGFLYTRTPEGRPRYPNRAWLAEYLPLARGRAALHVCGGRARAELLAGDLEDLLAHVRRIQVNGVLAVEEVEQICAQNPGHTVITQHKSENFGLLAVSAPNHALLVDGSGGRGLAPESWIRPETAKPVGFAGGLGPDTLGMELLKIRSVARGPWWVDMEGRIRTEDWFDHALALRTLGVFVAKLPFLEDGD